MIGVVSAMSNEIMVSIKCLAYNHEKYIAQMFEGCLAQKVKFKYEIIVHEDASTDNTASIVREYEKKYPDIIVPIYEKENMYMSGRINDIIYEKVRGKYIAFCEGDDYWIDETKLQRQIDYLEQHQECSFCFHDAIIVWENGKRCSNFFPDKIMKNVMWNNCDATFNPGQLIELGFIPTASIVGRTKYVKKTRKFCDNEVCGDLPLRLSLSMDGYGHYINRRMSAYRSGNPNSASGKAQGSYDNMMKTYEGHCKILKSFDNVTEKVWHQEVEHDMKKRLLRTLMIAQKSELIKEYGLTEMFWKETTLKWKIKYFVHKYFERFYEFLRAVRNSIKGF